MYFDVFDWLKSKIKKNTWICLLSGLISGWFTHYYLLSHKFTNWDDVNFLYGYGSGEHIGRWFLKYVHPIGTSYSVPAIHGSLMILFLSLSACLVLEILHLKSATAAIIIPVLMVTFPSVACTMSFMFMAHTSGIAIFMFCLAVYLIRKSRWGIVPGAILMICGLGIYQSYVSIAIVLLLLGMIVDILDGMDFKRCFRNGVIYVITLLIMVSIYIWLSHVFYPNLDNETYGGVGSMGKIALSDMPRLIGRCYKRFGEYFLWKPFEFITPVMQWMNILTIVLNVLFGIILFIIKKLYCRKEGILYIVCALFVPFGAAFIYFMGPEVPYSMLMLYSYVFIYIMVIMLWERISLSAKTNCISKIVSVTTVIVLSISGYTNYLVTNTAYLRTDFAFQRVSAYYNRILANVESTDGYKLGDQVAILGEFHYLNKPSIIEGASIATDQVRTMDGVALENGLLTMGARDKFILNYLGISMNGLTLKEKLEIMETSEYKSMPVYPDDGSICKLNDIWIVKLCE